MKKGSNQSKDGMRAGSEHWSRVVEVVYRLDGGRIRCIPDRAVRPGVVGGRRLERQRSKHQRQFEQIFQVPLKRSEKN